MQGLAEPQKTSLESIKPVDSVSTYDSSSPNAINRRSVTAGALQSAIAFLRQGLRSDGTYEGVHEWETKEHQWRILASWAAGEGLIVDPRVEPEREGGVEHDVSHAPGQSRWIKFTKPYSAGYAIDVAGQSVFIRLATPLEYLERWRIGNRYLGDDAEFLGISEAHQGKRLVISQRDAVGEAASWDEIEAAFTEQRPMRRIFTPEGLGGYEARAYVWGRFGVFDVRPQNCVRTAAGVILPIDVIPQIFRKEDAKTLAALG